MITRKNTMQMSDCSQSNTWTRVSAVLSEIAVQLSAAVYVLTDFTFTALDTILESLALKQTPKLQPIRIDDQNTRPHTNS